MLNSKIVKCFIFFVLWIPVSSANGQVLIKTSEKYLLGLLDSTFFINGYYTTLPFTKSTKKSDKFQLNFDTTSLKVTVLKNIHNDSDLKYDAMLVLQPLNDKSQLVVGQHTIFLKKMPLPNPILNAKIDSINSQLLISLEIDDLFFKRNYKSISSLDASAYKIKKLVISYHNKGKTETLIYEFDIVSSKLFVCNLLKEIPDYNNDFFLIDLQVTDGWRRDRFLKWNLEKYENLKKKYN